jgi:protein gp37
MADTDIEWTEKVWNPVRGCSIVSAGCTNCYAMKQAHRFSGKGQPYEGLTKMSRGGPVWTGRVEVILEMLDAPLRWRKPARVFVNSMSDLFHADVPEHFIDAVFGVMLMTPHHTYQILTKRPDRMHKYMRDGGLLRPIAAAAKVAPERRANDMEWPPRNVWLGVSVEDKLTAYERIPSLLDTPAAKRFVSYEPALGPVDFSPWLRTSPSAAFEAGKVTRDMPDWTRIGSTALDWIIVGGESGRQARPSDVQWARDTVRQCREAGLAVFVKQLGARPGVETATDGPTGRFRTQEGRQQYERTLTALALRDKKGADMNEWPEDLRVREFPA